MAYQKHTWKERLGTGLNKFKDTITGTIMALVNQPDSVTQEGTPVRADWLNEMEEGIYQAHVTADAALPKTAKAADSEKLDGKTLSTGLGGDTVVLRTQAGYIQAIGFRENGFDLRDIYLGKTSKAADSDKLDGKDSSDFATSEQGTKADDALPKNRLNLGMDSSERNFNNYTTPGFYSLQSANDYSNKPAFDFSWGMLIVYRKSNMVWQIIYTWRSDVICIRQITVGGTAYQWRYISENLYGTGTPPSTLSPGQIYIQY